MDKEIDDQIYYDLYRQFNSDVNLSHQRRVILTRIIKLFASEPEIAYYQIGEELQGSGQLQKSIIAFKRATIIEPENFSAQRDLANALFKLEKEDEAFDSIKKALSLNPTSHSLHEFLIETLEKKNRLEDLESFSKEILDMNADPKSIPIFYFASAQALVSHEKSSQALVLYQKSIDSGLVMRYNEHFNYGMVLYYQGLFEDSIVQFQLALESAPNDKAALNNIAHINYCLGNIEKAREEFEYIIANGLETHLTYSNYLLMLYHLDENEEVINDCKNRLEQSITPYGFVMPKIYNRLLKITQAELERDDVDEKAKEFNRKKLEGINLVLSFINERMNAHGLH